MRRVLIHAALMAALVGSVAVDGAAQQAPPMAAHLVKPPQLRGWTDGPQPLPQLPRMPEAPVSEIETPEKADVAKENEQHAEAQTDAELFLLPIWSRGFWAMPPGGLTRGWWQPPIPINPESSLAFARRAPQCPAGADVPGRNR